MGVFANSIQDGVGKSLGFAQALANKGLEFFPADRKVSLVLYLMLMLLPTEQGGILQESNRKRNSVWARATGGGKLIFSLLEEIVISQVSFTLINIWELIFQRPLTSAFIVRSSSDDKSRNRCKRSGI